MIQTLPLDETLEAYAQLIEQGKVRAIGASNYTAKRLAEASQISKKKGPAAVRESANRSTTSTIGAEFEADLAPLLPPRETSA